MKQKEKMVLFSILVVLAVIAVIAVPSALADIPPSKTYPANAVWFDHEVSSAEYCETVDVDVWINISPNYTISFHGEFDYTSGCVEVTKFVGNMTNWPTFCEAGLTPGHVIITGANAIIPANPPGVTHIGTLTIHCCNETSPCLTDLVWDTAESYIEGPDYNEIKPVTWHDGTFTCESEEKPDLVVEKSVTIADGNFSVVYTVTNNGSAPAGESTTCKYVDGELMESQACPALGPGESHGGTFLSEHCPCGATINVTVCADNAEEVDESDETNNCEVNFVDCPYIEVDIRADGIASNIFNAADYMICPGTVTEDGVTIDNETAMGALVIYCQNNGINVYITLGTWGEYVVQIGNDPADNNSWSYAVNEEVPPVGGAQKVIFDGDRVHWYNYNLQYYSVLTAIDKTEIVVGETITATVTWKNITGIHLLNGASVNVGPMGPWGPEPGPSVGTTGVDGTCTFPWSTVGTWGVYAVDPVHGSGIYNYPPVSFTCSQEKPDLVVTKTVSFSDSTFTVNYTVSNIGTAPANESTTCKYVDGELMEDQACPTLNPGESFNGSFNLEPCPCGSILNVTVCADNDNVVNESDETNNCEVNIIECPSIKVDIRADGIADNIFDVTGYSICPGTVTEDGVTIDNETAMGALVIYCQNNGINVYITLGTWGEYVVQIGNDPADNNSWSYAVNEEVPPVGGAQKVIFDGDRVHWYNYNLHYYEVLTAIDKTEIVVGESLTATVTWKNITGIHLLNGASVNVGPMGPWGPEPGPSVGTTGVDGTCTFPWSTVGTWGVYAVDPVHGSGIYNYPPVSFTCSQEKPDLVVTKTVSFSDSTFTVNYTVSNIGTAPANESTTCKYLDGELMEDQACPTLNPGESYNGSFYPESCPCGSTLNVTVCADNDNVVNESDETNNCEVNIIECPYIIVDIRADGIASNIFDVADYMICPGTVTEDGITIDNETAMGAVVAYCQDNGINVQITMTGLGEYVVQIGNDPVDNNSWMYAVNGVVPPVGGAQEVIFDGDLVHWYNYNLQYYSVLTAIDKTEIVVGETITATVTWKNITGIHLLNGASVHVGVMGPWGPEPGPSVGTTGVDGTCTFPWSTVGTWGVYAVDPVHGSGIYNYPPVSFTCSKEEKPDLVVEKKWEMWVEEAARRYNVSYVILNNGTAIAPRGHNSTLYVDDIEIEHKPIPVDLAPGDNYTDTFDTVIACTGNFDTIKVCVDNDNVVYELNETNNCLENVWPTHCPAEIAVYQADVPNADGILNALRTQRDDNLKDEYVDRYYGNSPELAKVIGCDSALTNEAARLLSKYSPMVSQDAHRIDVDTLITERDVKEIESFIGRFKESVLNNRDGISADSTEELIKFLDEFEKQVEASEGKTFSEALHDSIYYKNEQMPGHENEGYLHTPL